MSGFVPPPPPDPAGSEFPPAGRHAAYIWVVAVPLVGIAAAVMGSIAEGLSHAAGSAATLVVGVLFLVIVMSAAIVAWRREKLLLLPLAFLALTIAFAFTAGLAPRELRGVFRVLASIARILTLLTTFAAVVLVARSAWYGAKKQTPPPLSIAGLLDEITSATASSEKAWGEGGTAEAPQVPWPASADQVRARRVAHRAAIAHAYPVLEFFRVVWAVLPFLAPLIIALGVHSLVVDARTLGTPRPKGDEVPFVQGAALCLWGGAGFVFALHRRRRERAVLSAVRSVADLVGGEVRTRGAIEVVEWLDEHWPEEAPVYLSRPWAWQWTVRSVYRGAPLLISVIDKPRGTLQAQRRIEIFLAARTAVRASPRPDALERARALGYAPTRMASGVHLAAHTDDLTALSQGAISAALAAAHDLAAG